MTQRQGTTLACFVLIASCLLLLARPLYAIDDRDILMDEAKNLSWEKKYDESIEIYKKILKQNPNDVDAAVGHARVSAWSGDYAKALEIYEGILKKDPNNREALLEKGRVYSWQERYKESLATLEQLLALDPENQEALDLKKAVQRAGDGVTHFKVRSGFEYQTYNFATNAPGAHFLLSYTEPKKWSARCGFDYINKFGDSAPGYRVGGSYWATEGTVLSLDVDFAPKQVVVPEEGVTFEVSQRIFKVLVPSLGFRFANYQTAKAYMMMPGATWYFYPRFDWMAKYILSLSEFGGNNHTNNSMMTRLTWNAVDQLILFAGYAYASESFESGNPVNQFGAFHANHVFGGLKLEIYRKFGIDFDYDYERRNNGSRLHTYNAGVFYSW
ncbi:MAG: tetratricopeptide repeat protein [Pseudomonadota bacterium]